jgi:uncharacterized protein YjbI with pentapeptide repeats
MANQKQLDILKQGVHAWNRWRTKNAGNEIDLSDVDFKGKDLSYVNFSTLNDIQHINLIKSDLSQTYLLRADLRGTNLYGANLSNAILVGANLRGAILESANFTGSVLNGANIGEINFRQVNLADAHVGGTTFGNTDLSSAIGLDEVKHHHPSFIDSQTIKLSKGKLPDVFLRGCGLSDWEIESTKLYNPELTNEAITEIQYRIFDLRATRSLQISPLFISYSHADKEFVDHLDTSLTGKGVRFWRDIHDAKAGRLETQIDRAIHQNPTVLLVFSENSLGSDWVEHEVRHARKLEKELGRDMLCPIALDDSWKSSPWPERVMEQVKEYNILDFSGWQDKSTFDRQFAKLLSGLEIFYKKPGEK